LTVLPIVLSIGLAIAALAVLVTMTAGTDKSKRLSLRLAALDQEFAPTNSVDSIADIRRHVEGRSGSPWLDRLLAKMNLANTVNLYLYQAGMPQTVGVLVASSIAGMGVAGTVLYLRFDAFFPALFLSAGFLPLPFLYVRMKRARRLAQLEQQLPEALGLIISAIRVGHSLIASLGAVGKECPEPIAAEIRKCYEEQNYGLDLRTGLFNLLARVPIQDFRIFAAAVLIQKDSGGNLAEVLENAVQTIRERSRLKMQVRVHTAQGRLTGWVLSLLPLTLGIGMYLADPESISILWKRPVGIKLLYAATGMDIVGALVIRKIVRIRI
jgi:tight adherence protein B